MLFYDFEKILDAEIEIVKIDYHTIRCYKQEQLLEYNNFNDDEEDDFESNNVFRRDHSD